MNTDEELVFVYGTLRSGASNAFRMEGGERVSAARVRGRLYWIDWYPGLVLSDGDAGDSGDEWVHGEVWRVSAEMLARLDEFEGASTEDDPDAEYRRVRATAEEAGSGRSFQPWVWEWRGILDEQRRIPSGDWMEVEG